jgi:hypothetical protein
MFHAEKNLHSRGVDLNGAGGHRVDRGRHARFRGRTFALPAIPGPRSETWAATFVEFSCAQAVKHFMETAYLPV